jgi:peptidoglycan-associated lipoprotein
MRRVLPFLLLAAASCATTKKETPEAPPPAAAQAPATAQIDRTPVAPRPAACQADADCAANQLCLDSSCVAIDATTGACDTIATHFDFDRSTVLAEDFPALQRAARCLKARPGTKVRIEGNCDERGTTGYNLALGQRRAAAAQKYLLDLGIPGQRTPTVSYGKEKPRCAEHTETCWASNRRDDLVKVP